MSKARDIADLGSNDVLETSSTGVEVTGDVSLGDNGKVKLGASDDLQIYHDGSASYIVDTGTGTLNIKASGSIRLRGNDTDELLARFNENGSNQFYYDNAEKLATTSTGVDVTGTVTADALTVQTAQGNINVRSDASAVDFLRDGSNYFRATGASGDFRFTTGNGGYGNVALALDDNNDVYFYEDTGTTAKMVWDASAEGLELSSLTSYVVTNSGKAVGGLDIKGAYNGLNTYGAGISLGTGGTGRSAIAAVAQHASDNDSNGLAFFVHGSSGSTADSSEAMRIDSSGNVGIGTDSPVLPLDVHGGTIGVTSASAFSGLQITSANNSFAYVNFGDSDDGNIGQINYNHADNSMKFVTNNAERARLDSSGNLLVGKTSTAFGTDGVEIKNDQIWSTNTSSDCLSLNRKTTDGSLATFYKDGSTVGSIGTGIGRVHIGSDDCRLFFDAGSSNAVWPWSDTATSTGDADNTIDFGDSVNRFKDIYATNGTIQTSDRNEKQDIEVLNEAEQRVAQACKGLLRKFRWQDSVAEKGDDARIHFGIIAQDLQDAFTAEGLDAGRYAMFISTTWTDEETGEERTRLGVRYPELLAFIISAL